MFEVKSASTRASKIVINDIKVTVDQFGYLGDYKGSIFNHDKSDQIKIDEGSIIYCYRL